MKLETYNNILCLTYFGLFLTMPAVGVITGIFLKRSRKYLWVFFLTCLYGFCGMFNKLVWFIDWDDPASPNYDFYRDWTLLNAVSQDIKLLLVFLILAALFYFSLIRKNRTVRIFLAAALFLGIAAAAVMLALSFVSAVAR